MGRLLFMFVVLVLLCGCKVGYEKRITATDDSKELVIYKVKGTEVDCIRSDHGLSCNWESYNISFKNK